MDPPENAALLTHLALTRCGEEGSDEGAIEELEDPETGESKGSQCRAEDPAGNLVVVHAGGWRRCMPGCVCGGGRRGRSFSSRPLSQSLKWTTCFLVPGGRLMLQPQNPTAGVSI